MIIIYYCFGSAHSSVLSAAIHTNMLPEDRVPDNEEIINLPLFDKTPSEKIGTLYFYGKDEAGNDVYVLGMGKARSIVKRSLKSFLELEKIPDNKVYIKNTLQYVNFLVRIGGFLSRGYGIIFPGRILTIYGIKKSYFRFVKAVKELKVEIGIA